MIGKICKVSEDFASRQLDCQCCGEKIAKGGANVKVCTPKRVTGYHLHIKCAQDFSRKTWACEGRYNTESNSDSISCKNHKVVVYGSIDDLMYFKGENEMHAKKLNKFFARFQTDWKSNRQSIGSVLSTCFKHGCRCFVVFDDKTMIEVFSKAQYTELTDTM